MARGRRQKHANSLKKEAKKASGREKAQASQPAVGGSSPAGIQTHTHIRCAAFPRRPVDPVPIPPGTLSRHYPELGVLLMTVG